MEQHRTTLATHFLHQGQFGIGVKGGIDLVIQATAADVHNLISTPANPQHALLSLDIRNMFNEVSRNATLATLRNTPALHPLLPYYRLLYDGPNTCWYKPAHDQTHQCFFQHEGHAQGDPLSGAFSSIPLALLLNQIRPQLIQRQQQRQPHPTPTHPTPPLHAPRCYMDDTSIILHHEDISWFIHQFQQHGPQFGIHLNPTKTQLLTATNHSATHTASHPHPNPHIRQALQLLMGADPHTTPQITTGIRLLGAPIGSPAFCHQFLQSAAQQFRHRTNRLLKLIPDPQSSSTVFRSCLQPSIAHLFFTDLTTPSPTTNTTFPHDPHDWQSIFLDHVMTTTTHFLRQLTLQAQPLPPTAMLLAFHPAAAGGAGYRDLTATAIPQTITAIHRSLHYANHGLPTPDHPPQAIPPIYTASLRTPHLSPNPTQPTPRLDIFSNFINNTKTLYQT